MSRPAIVVENLSKKFRIGTAGGPGYHRLSEMLTGLPRYAYNKLRPQRVTLPPGESSPSEERASAHPPLPPPASSLPPASDFWALRDVSFEVQPGEVVGIIGRNGAGKSTLLKVLSRITEPTSGRFGVRGRVASLLEVGTGFHPELTGRENIYVSGITLGMTRAEIKKRFDEIVDFSGVEKFLDTPVKHYSSGMQVRLGFAVAAHLESEILIVDEVLAVGDAAFQRRSLGKIEKIAGSGRTVMLVTHSMSLVGRNCRRAILLDAGTVSLDGESQKVVTAYQLEGRGCFRKWDDPASRPGSDQVRLIEASVTGADGQVRPTLHRNEDEQNYISIRYELFAATHPVFPIVIVHNEHQTPIFTAYDDSESCNHLRSPGIYTSTLALPNQLLLPGTYSVSIFLRTLIPKIKHVNETDLISFAVADDPNASDTWFGDYPGLIRPKLHWNTQLWGSQELYG